MYKCVSRALSYTLGGNYTLAAQLSENRFSHNTLRPQISKRSTLMKKLLILIIVLAVCSAIIYTQQNDSSESHTASEHAHDMATDTAQSSASDSAATSLPVSNAAEGARVYFVSPQDGDVVSSPVTVQFGIENMQVAPAGIDEPYSGHHHILINMEELPDMTKPLPATDSLIHFGGGQTEASLELPAGEHTLQLLLGNYLHIPHDQPVISEKITITVE